MPAPVSAGTGLFIGACAVAIIWAWAAQKGGYIKKDDFQVITVLVVTATISTWLLWLCAWMHQWHPLILPEYKGGH